MVCSFKVSNRSPGCGRAPRAHSAASSSARPSGLSLVTRNTPSAQATREETLTAVYRAARIQQHGFAATLREIMAQEGYAMAMAGCSKPSLDDDELEYAREVIAPNLDSKDYPTIITSLFGDVAAVSLGYTPPGLSERAGFALALSDALKR